MMLHVVRNIRTINPSNNFCIMKLPRLHGEVTKH